MRRVLFLVGLAVVVPAALLAQTPTCPSGPPCQGGPLPSPLPLLPPTNWWNLDVSAAPVDPQSSSYIGFIGTTVPLHPDFGGEVSPGSVDIYGFPYIVVPGTQPTRSVQFYYANESDPGPYPIPDQAITLQHWIEGGQPGDAPGPGGDRHMLIVDQDHRILYELYNAAWNGTGWTAGSGAIFNLSTNDRRPEGWTSADAAGLAILPGLVRYDEVFGPNEIGHALRMTVSSSNGYVYPASHVAGSTTGALPMGARLRLKPGTNISSFDASSQKIFRALKKYGLIVADNGSDMYISGTFDVRWDNSILNPDFGSLTANDFEVIQLGWNPPPAVTLVSPSVSASTTTPTYTWNAVGGATEYYLWVSNPTGPVIQVLYTATLAGCASGTGTCRVTPNTALTPGTTYTWWIQARNAAAIGPWSSSLTFTVPPGPATLVSPSGSASTTLPTYTWNVVSGASDYYLWVTSPAGPVIQTWYTSAQASCTTTCSVTPTTALTVGTAYTWWIQARNVAGTGPWSASSTFTESGSAPGPATLVSPAGSASTTTPTYTWNAVSGSTWYYLWVSGPAGTPVIQTWYTSTQAGCVNGTGACSVIPSTALATGTNKWWIRTWNASGYGPWSSSLTFTVP